MTANPYRTDPRWRLRVVENINGHVMATCRDAKGCISYVCIHCGRESIPMTCGQNVCRRSPDSFPLDACPAVILDGSPWQESEYGWYVVGDPERAPIRERVMGYELWLRRRRIWEKDRNP